MIGNLCNPTANAACAIGILQAYFISSVGFSLSSLEGKKSRIITEVMKHTPPTFIECFIKFALLWSHIPVAIHGYKMLE